MSNRRKKLIEVALLPETIKREPACEKSMGLVAFVVVIRTAPDER